jgi:hypothetical protein
MISIANLARRTARVAELILGAGEICLAVRVALSLSLSSPYWAYALFFLVVFLVHGVALLFSARWAIWLAIALLLIANFFAIFYYGIFGGSMAGSSQREIVFFLVTALNAGVCLSLLYKTNGLGKKEHDATAALE